jgi:phosphohistidine phosphatase
LKLLGLLRHAKSDWDDPSLADFDRPLSPRGGKAAPAMGKYFRELGLAYDLALVSPARRAADTFALVQEAWGIEPEVRIEPRLYHASLAQMLAVIADIPANIRSLLIVGHNPGLHELALNLTRGDTSAERGTLAVKLPTGALVEIQLPSKQWSGLGEGEIVRFVRPRDLE